MLAADAMQYACVTSPTGGARLHVVLMQPEIPQNTGNIARTCACAGAGLHLVHPMGFHLTERNVRRSGMDYFEHVQLTQWPTNEAFLMAHGEDALVFFTGSATRLHTQFDYVAEAAGGAKARAGFGASSDAGDATALLIGDEADGPRDVFLVFGRESTGIDPDILARFPSRCARIPMMPGRRSLNLANSVAIALYEAARQLGFPGLV